MQTSRVVAKPAARGKPRQLKAKLAMAAFIVVAATSMTLTSAGVLHAVTQANAPASQIANVPAPVIEVLR